ncbi:MAG: NADH-quinone oxidoreductase subunit L, partial [Deltaproteobacteria bacterium CG_4_10_14_0_2_um_filter_43_8]
YVDEIYNALIVKPLLWISRVVLWKGVDATGIDGMMVHGTARSVSLWSQLVSAMQSGSLQQYLLYFFSGAVVLLAYFLL